MPRQRSPFYPPIYAPRGGVTFQGRGIYRALVAHRARIAAERGFRYLQVDALPTSRPILERLGFVQLSKTTPYTRRPT